jgi:hypothetical protein
VNLPCDALSARAGPLRVARKRPQSDRPADARASAYAVRRLRRARLTNSCEFAADRAVGARNGAVFEIAACFSIDATVCCRMTYGPLARGKLLVQGGIANSYETEERLRPWKIRESTPSSAAKGWRPGSPWSRDAREGQAGD